MQKKKTPFNNRETRGEQVRELNYNFIVKSSINRCRIVDRF